jgi:hypothetical protein
MRVLTARLLLVEFPPREVFFSLTLTEMPKQINNLPLAAVDPAFFIAYLIRNQ